MKLVIYSVILNQHQAPVADCLWSLTNHEFVFVELVNLGDTKGGSDDYSKRPYLLRAWESAKSFEKAMDLARTADCCIFSGIESLPFEKERMKLGLLSFDMGERWLKQGRKSFASPRLLKWLAAYYLGGWKDKTLYKLCMSAFAAEDHYKMGTFKGKAYKWGYFTEVPSEVSSFKIQDSSDPIRLMWCARFIGWKHPELAIECAKKLKAEGYKFQLDMYGDGPLRNSLMLKAESFGIGDSVEFHGNVPNDQIHQAMKESDIFLFTSDRQEGWGAVANEAMSEGCCLVGSNQIGAVPFLVKDGVNGVIFESGSIDSLYKKVRDLIDNYDKRIRIASRGQLDMKNLWSPTNAAKSLLQLIDDLQQGKDSSIIEGPCSKA